MLIARFNEQIYGGGESGKMATERGISRRLENN
jgi:hypothetical protein